MGVAVAQRSIFVGAGLAAAADEPQPRPRAAVALGARVPVPAGAAVWDVAIDALLLGGQELCPSRGGKNWPIL